MTQSLLDENIHFLRNSGIEFFDDNYKNNNAYHYIANSLADLDYRLSNEDILFTFSKKIDIKMVVKEDAKEKIKKEKRGPKPEEFKKDPAGQIDTERLGIYTKDNIFFEYKVSLDEHAYTELVDISRRTLESIQPDFTNYNQEDDPRYRNYKKLDHLIFCFRDSDENIKLYGHMINSNKALQEISREFFKRL
ncbi:hypothetical protein RJB75_04730 [Staphylococcus hominis]|uniref:hypothetical protein n=1 Tax=Staphylococcus hominis TaxID=1290 RepID=UPI00287A3E54|nr:hypothetical protein [Staphylococcus hominis]MDS3839247.1 hypothetical protein [Staphylococcus hominis]MDS3918694.1 hypothetical protein [Staphylococcus hominis]